MLDAAPCPPEPFDGFDPADIEGSIERLVEFNRRSAKTHSGIYRDLAVRRRRTEVDAILGPVDRPLVRRTAELIHAIEDGRRVCERANLDLLAAYERLGSWERLNAVIQVVGAPDRAASGPLHGVPVAVKDNIDMAGLVTTNASTVAVPPPAERDAAVVAALRAAGADLFCKTNLLEYAAGSVNPAYGMTFNPHDLERTSGGSSSGSAALVAAGVCRHALGTDTGGSIRIPASYCGIVGLKPTPGLLPLDGVFPLSPSCDTVGTLTRSSRGAAQLLEAITGRPYAIQVVTGVRVGVIDRQLRDPDLRPDVRERVEAAITRLANLGFDLVEIDIPELDLADAALGDVVLKEALDVHRRAWRPRPRLRPRDAGAAAGGRGGRRRAVPPRPGRHGARGSRDSSGCWRWSMCWPGPRSPTRRRPRIRRSARPRARSRRGSPGRTTWPGCPALSVPCGLVEDYLPVGLQLGSAAGAEELLLSVSATFEEGDG